MDVYLLRGVFFNGKKWPEYVCVCVCKCTVRGPAVFPYLSCPVTRRNSRKEPRQIYRRNHTSWDSVCLENTVLLGLSAVFHKMSSRASSLICWTSGVFRLSLLTWVNTPIRPNIVTTWLILPRSHFCCQNSPDLFRHKLCWTPGVLWYLAPTS